MQYFLPSLYTSLQLLVVIGIGIGASRWNLVPETFRKGASIFLVHIALPLYFFAKFAVTDFSILKTAAVMPVTALIVILLGIGLGSAVFSFLPFRGNEKRAGIALSGFGNAGFIPLTLIEAFPLSLPLISEKFGIDAPALFVGAFVLLYSPILWSLGNALIKGKNHDDSEGRLKFTQLVSPPVYGILAGVLFSVLGLKGVFLNPELPFMHIHNALKNLGSVILPMVLFNLGLMIGGIKLHTDHKKRLRIMTLGVISVRFLLLPACFYAAYFLFLRRFNLNPAIIFVLFLETHTPPATNLSTMALKNGVNEDLTAYTLLITYTGYVLVLPLFLMLLLGILP